MNDVPTVGYGEQYVGVVPLETIAEEGGLKVMQGILEGRLPGRAPNPG